MSNLTIKDVSRGRGLDGSTTLDFPVVLDAPSDKDVTVHVATKPFPFGPKNELAQPGVDYDDASATVVIPAGQTEASFPVTIHGTSDRVPDRLFLVQIVKASVPIHDGSAFGIMRYGTAAETT